MHKISAIFLLALCSESSWAQEASMSNKKHELGINGSKIVGLLMGAAPEMQPWSIHYKQQRDKYWLRASLRYESYPDIYYFERFLRDSLLVQRSVANNSRAAAAAVGLEKRKTLSRGWQFTYGADALYRYQYAVGWSNETRYADFDTIHDSFFGPRYVPSSANFTSDELERNEIRSNQFGIMFTAGLLYNFNKRLGLHMQMTLAGWLSQNNFKKRNYLTNEASNGTNWTWETQRLPGFSEIALYYRF
jgi:hypothetical protein